ncbi:IclR family transcriptional regulator [Arthrobacter koreensis]|jgi:DNA-binding IclR family transcriptional regulator|uniref:IclR family transcriptional regulator n=1 Tax=Arthrobacter koreensis TaxID=199136 RepID=UPI001D01D4EB|nr:IclR family transcriptional regulator [Arthrobacter koreensis]
MEWTDLPEVGAVAGQAAAKGKSVTSRALNILGAFDAGHVKLTLSEISRRSDTPVATCHRLLGELLEWGAVAKRGNHYYVGHRLWSLGLLAPVEKDLKTIAGPYMQDVLFATRQVVNLFVLEGQHALLIERFSGTAVGKPVAQVGDRLPLHVSAAGKVLLGYAPAEVRAKAFANLIRRTPYTVTEPGKLHRQIQEARDNGYALTREEQALGTSGLAVPVLNGSGQLLAALGVVFIGPMREPERVIPALQVAAAAVGREIGSLG